MNTKNFFQFFSFQGNLSKREFWKNYFEKLLFLSYFNFLLGFLFSFEGDVRDYGVYFYNEYIGALLGLTYFFIFIIFSIYLLAICRKRVRDNGNDSLITILYSLPLTIISGIYIAFISTVSLEFFINFVSDGRFRDMNKVYMVIFSTLIIAILNRKLKK